MKPRISANYAYGSWRNKSPMDSVNQTFDIFYGFNQPFSRDDYIAWNNVGDASRRASSSRIQRSGVDTAFSAYWLASAAAAWDRANYLRRRATEARSLAIEYDLRIR
ncbi:MAG: alginate export family protein [Methylocystis sp.]